MLPLLTCLAVLVQGGQHTVPGFFDSRYLPLEINKVIEGPDRVTVARCTTPYGFKSSVPDEKLGIELTGPRREVSKPDITNLRNLMRLPVDPKRGESACTFSPDHVIRFAKGDRKVEVVTCFTCGVYLMYLDGEKFSSVRHSAAMGDYVGLKALVDRYTTDLEKALLVVLRFHRFVYTLAVQPFDLEVTIEGKTVTLPAKAVGELAQLMAYDLWQPNTKDDGAKTPFPEIVLKHPRFEEQFVISANLGEWKLVEPHTAYTRGSFGKWRRKAHLILTRALGKR